MDGTAQPLRGPNLLPKRRSRVPELKEPGGLRFDEPLAPLQGAIDCLGVVLGTVACTRTMS